MLVPTIEQVCYSAQAMLELEVLLTLIELHILIAKHDPTYKHLIDAKIELLERLNNELTKEIAAQELEAYKKKMLEKQYLWHKYFKTTLSVSMSAVLNFLGHVFGVNVPSMVEYIYKPIDKVSSSYMYSRDLHMILFGSSKKQVKTKFITKFVSFSNFILRILVTLGALAVSIVVLASIALAVSLVELYRHSYVLYQSHLETSRETKKLNEFKATLATLQMEGSDTIHSLNYARVMSHIKRSEMKLKKLEAEKNKNITLLKNAFVGVVVSGLLLVSVLFPAAYVALVLTAAVVGLIKSATRAYDARNEYALEVLKYDKKIQNSPQRDNKRQAKMPNIYEIFGSANVTNDAVFENAHQVTNQFSSHGAGSRRSALFDHAPEQQGDGFDRKDQRHLGLS